MEIKINPIVKAYFLTFSIILIFLPDSKAEILELNSDFGKGTITRDAYQNLDFLDVDITKGYSYNDIASELNDKEQFKKYRYATRSEVTSLASNWREYNSYPSEWADGLVDLLGVTHPGGIRETMGFIQSADLGRPPIPQDRASAVRIMDYPVTPANGDQVRYQSFPRGTTGLGHFLVKDVSSIIDNIVIPNDPLVSRGTLRLYNNSGFSNSFDQTSSYFDLGEDTFVIVHGWNGAGSSIAKGSFDEIEWVEEMAQSLRKSEGEDANILAFDWSELANSTSFNPMSVLLANSSSPPLNIQKQLALYIASGGDWWVPNSEVPEQAGYLANQIKNLFSSDLASNPSKINFIGHSLGGAISAEAMKNLALLENEDAFFDLDLNRLTILDAPENGYAALAGGRVNLDDVITWLSSNVPELAIDNISGAISGPLGHYGRAYSDAHNTEAAYSSHTGIIDWFVDTINPDDYATNVGYQIGELTSPHSLGFSLDDNSILEKSNKLTNVGGYLNIVDYDTGVEIDSFKDPYQIVSESSTPRILYQITETDGTVYYSYYSPSENGYVIDLDEGLEMVTGSPIYVYYDLYIPENTVGFKLDFKPETWSDTDVFFLAIDGVSIFSLSGSHFFEDWMSTEFLDVSYWAGTEVMVTYGFLSDYTGHRVLTGSSYFKSELDPTGIPIPSPLHLLAFTLLIPFFSKKRRGSFSDT